MTNTVMNPFSSFKKIIKSSEIKSMLVEMF